ncbi:hypothetical protein P389DRAFT_205414 [Cystobasidium minutum MCA 4210]|uniref:uncharacterized protein n=1 Tax=Cystobasidium minutum MCA 4210 TaxID=1397322 RepID=UPI0034CF6BE7|eukprot:jgi/Rhomi1/205414/MIX6243_27_64
MMMMNPNANFSMATTWVNGSTTTLAKTHSLPFRGGTPFPARRDTVGVSTDSSRLDRLPKATRKAPPAGFSYGDKILANPENTGVFLEERQRTDAVLRCLSCDRVLGKRMLDHNPVLISHADKDLEKGNLWKLFCSTSCWFKLQKRDSVGRATKVILHHAMANFEPVHSVGPRSIREPESALAVLYNDERTPPVWEVQRSHDHGLGQGHLASNFRFEATNYRPTARVRVPPQAACGTKRSAAGVR